MIWKTILDIFLEVLKYLATGVSSILILIVIASLVVWRIYVRYKKKDILGYSVVLKDIEEAFKTSDSLQSLEGNFGGIKFEFKKESNSRREELKFPRYWPEVIRGKGRPFKVISMFEDEDKNINDVSLLAYYIPVVISKDSILQGKKLYFMYSLVPDDFRKFDKLRIPMDGFNVEDGQILGYVGESNDFFILLAKFLWVLNIRINVLNNKIPILSPVNGFIGHKLVDDFEPVKIDEYLLAIYYPIPPKELSPSA